MDILCLNYEFPPLGGGAANALSCLLKEFSNDASLNIAVVTSSPDTYKEQHFSENIKIYSLDIGKENKNLHYQSNKDLLTFSLKSYFFCKQLLKTNRYDLCHAFFGIPCGFIAMKLGIPYIVSLRGSDVPFYNPRFHWFDRLFFGRLSRKIWGNAKQVIANSEGLKNLALKNAPEQEIAVIPNGIDTNQFQPALTQSEVLRVLCISRLIRRKGVDLLIKAIAQLPKDQIRLKIVGKGDQEDELKRLASFLGLTLNVEFMGYIPHEKIVEVYQKSDIFVLPSLNEGMSNAILEAMACGLPVVTTDTGGTAELVKNNGSIVEKNNVASIAEALKKYLNNKELISQQGQQSRALTLKMSWQNAAKAYAAVYRTAAL